MHISYHKEMCSQKKPKNSVFIAETWRCLTVWMAINPLLLLSEPPGMSRNLILQEPDGTVRFTYLPRAPILEGGLVLGTGYKVS